MTTKYINQQEKQLPGSGIGGNREVRHVTIDEAAGQRVDNFLLGELAGVPRSRVYGMLRKGEVRVNGGRVRPDHRLCAGDVVRVVTEKCVLHSNLPGSLISKDVRLPPIPTALPS